MNLMNSNPKKKMTNSPFLILKFLKFYGEESALKPINSNTYSNIKAEATCTATGSPNKKYKHLEDPWKTKSIDSTKPSISNWQKETTTNKPSKRKNTSIQASSKLTESSPQLKCFPLSIKKRYKHSLTPGKLNQRQMDWKPNDRLWETPQFHQK